MSDIKERPVIFRGDMVRAIREGRKTQTRRVIKPQPFPAWGMLAFAKKGGGSWLYPNAKKQFLAESPLGKPGDRLWVKESTWLWCEKRPNGKTKTGRDKWHYVALNGAPVHYCADGNAKPTTSVVSPKTGNYWGWKFKTARFMPRWACRLTSELTDVQMQLVADINEEDAKEEGVTADCPVGYIPAHTESLYTYCFAQLWESIHGEGAWQRNDWVFAYTFRQVKEAQS